MEDPQIKTFVECRERDVDAQNRWYDECEKKGIPYVYVGLRTKYASVNWDHVSLHPNQDSQLMEDSEAIRTEILAVFHQYAGPKSRYDFSALAGKIDNLSPENARIVGARVFGILNSRLVAEPAT